MISYRVKTYIDWTFDDKKPEQNNALSREMMDVSETRNMRQFLMFSHCLLCVIWAHTNRQNDERWIYIAKCVRNKWMKHRSSKRNEEWKTDFLVINFVYVHKSNDYWRSHSSQNFEISIKSLMKIPKFSFQNGSGKLKEILHVNSRILWLKFENKRKWKSK